MVAVEPVAVLISRSSVWVAVLSVADDTVANVSESLFFSRCFLSRGLTHTRYLSKLELRFKDQNVPYGLTNQCDAFRPPTNHFGGQNLTKKNSFLYFFW